MILKNPIKRKPYLIWHVRDFDRLSAESIVENVLNYGDFADVKKIISILGINKVAAIFHKQAKRKRTNYSPKILNYFKAYFKKYAKPA